MSWQLDGSVNVIDVSVYQRDPWTHKPPDWQAVRDRNPSIRAVVMRMALWDDPTPDWDFEANWDGTGAAGFDQAVYVVVRTDRDPESQVDNWHRIAGSRAIGTVFLDAERADGVAPSRQLTVQGQTLAISRAAFADAEVDFYTANYYWRTIGQAAWMTDLHPLVARYPYANALTKRQYESFEQFRSGFNFESRNFPGVPTGFGAASGWQFCDKLIIPGISNPATNTPRVDGDLIAGAHYDRLFAGSASEPTPEPTPTDLGERLLTEAGNLRAAADRLQAAAAELRV